MRIHEIYPTQRINRQRSQPYDPDHIDRLRDLRQDRLPSGVFGSASPTRDPGEVIKSLHRPSRLDWDGFHQWMVTVQRLHQQGIDNPYFPTVYEIKVTRDPRGNTRPQYRLQKLLDIDDVPPAAVAAIFRRIFSVEELAVDQELAQADDSIENRGKDQAGFYIKMELARHIQAAVKGLPKIVSAIRDPEFLRAAKILKLIADRRGFSIDLHSGNILMRPGPGGAQLVIADPFSDGDRVSQPVDWWNPRERRDLANRSQSRRERLAAKPYQRISWGDYTVYYADPQDYSRKIPVRQFRARNDDHAGALHHQWRRSPEAERMAKDLGLSVFDFMMTNTPWSDRPRDDVKFKVQIRHPERDQPVSIDIEARDLDDARLRARYHAQKLKGTVISVVPADAQ